MMLMTGLFYINELVHLTLNFPYSPSQTPSYPQVIMTKNATTEKKKFERPGQDF